VCDKNSRGPDGHNLCHFIGESSEDDYYIVYTAEEFVLQHTQIFICRFFNHTASTAEVIYHQM